MTHEWVRAARRGRHAALRQIRRWTRRYSGILRTILLIGFFGSFIAETLAITNDDQANLNHLVFKDLGTVQQSTEMAHLHTTIPIDAAIKNFNEVVKMVSWVHHKAKEAGDEQTMKAVEYVMKDLARVEPKARAICDLVHCQDKVEMATIKPGNDTLERTARNVLYFVFGGLSIYNHYQLERLEAEVEANTANLRLLYAAVEEDRAMLNAHSAAINSLSVTSRDHEERINELEVKEGLNAMKDEFRNYALALHRWYGAVEVVLTERRLPLQLFDHGVLTRAYGELQQKVQTNGLELSLPDVASLVHADLSYSFRGGVMNVFVHVMVVRPEPFQLYELLPLPVRANDGRLVLIVEPRRFMALNEHETEAIDLTEEEVDDCKMLAGQRVCAASMIRKVPKASCVGALYFGSASAIDECTIIPYRASRELVVQVQSDEVAVIAPYGKVIKINVNCRRLTGGYTTKELKVSTIRRFKIKRGCSISTPSYSFHPKNEFGFITQFVLRSAPVLSGETIGDVKNWTLNRMTHHVNVTLPPLYRFDNMSQLDDMVEPHPVEMGSSIAMISISSIVILLVFGACIACCVCKCKKKESEAKGAMTEISMGFGRELGQILFQSRSAADEAQDIRREFQAMLKEAQMHLGPQVGNKINVDVDVEMVEM